MKKLITVLKTLAISFVLAGIIFAQSAIPVHASSSGTAYWGFFYINGYGIPSGKYYVYLNGTGLYSQYVEGQFQVAGSICNWNITAEFFNKNSQWLRTYNGAYHGGCSPIGTDYVWTNYTMSDIGFMCSTLKSNGSRITSYCLSIH